MDRNDLKYSLRISEILLFVNAKVLFLVICLASTILYVTRHLVIYEVFAQPLDNRDTHTKKIIKKEHGRELNSVPHVPSNYSTHDG